MSIREYLQNILDTEGWDAYSDCECEAWEAYCSDDPSIWETWMKEHSEIDFEAIENGFLVIELWAWDMCGE